MADATEKKKEFDDNYDRNYSNWSPFLAEAKKDLRCYEGDQWDEKKKAWLALQDREALVFNRVKRVVRVISGYERRNRLVMKVGPVGGEDDLACSQHTAVLMNIMNSNSGWPWMVVSDAFKFGPLITGMNLINFWPNRKSEIQFARNPFNKFMLDHNFTKIDLSDCYNLQRREMVTKEQAKRINPELSSEIMKIKPSGEDQKFPMLSLRYREDIYPYDEHFKRVTKLKRVVVFRQTGKQWLFDDFVKTIAGTKERAEFILKNSPLAFAELKDYVDTVELDVFFGGEFLKTYENPYGIDDFPFVLEIGDYVPEETASNLKVQSLIRPGRDPQQADNTRLCQMIDYFESVLGPGTDFEEDALVDEDDAYLAGQGQPRFFKKGKIASQAYKERTQADVPPGMFQLQQIFDRMGYEIPGINQELFEKEMKDVPGILWKLRQGETLTIQQDLFDNHRFSKKQLGKKLVRMVQTNFTQQMVQRITNEPVAPDFYRPDFTKYDCTLQEGLLTESQRQMAYAELTNMRERGMAIPDWLILEYAPIQLKHKIKQALAQGEKMQQMAAKIDQMEKQLTQQAKRAKIAADLGRAEERKSQVLENRANAQLSRVKTAKEIEGMNYERLEKMLDKLIKWEAAGKKEAVTRR